MVQKQKGNSGDPYLTDDDIKNIEYHDNKIVENIWGNSNGYNPNPNPNSKTGKKSAKDFRSKENKNNNNKKQKEEKPLPKYPTYKYSRPFLYEAVILGGIPSFISYAPKFDKILPNENIQEPGRILDPLTERNILTHPTNLGMNKFRRISYTGQS